MWSRLVYTYHTRIYNLGDVLRRRPIRRRLVFYPNLIKSCSAYPLCIKTESPKLLRLIRSIFISVCGISFEEICLFQTLIKSRVLVVRSSYSICRVFYCPFQSNGKVFTIFLNPVYKYHEFNEFFLYVIIFYLII